MATDFAGDFTLTTPNDLDIVMTRTFDAPRELVFAAWTQPEHLRCWWGCNLMQVTVCEVDLRVGGAWRIVLEMPDGEVHGFHGVYREIVAQERLVYTYVYEPMPDKEAVVTVTFETVGGKTLLTDRCTHQSNADRDGHLHSGMESGAAESYGRLAELLETLQHEGVTR